ncbi:aminotransferase class IV [Marinobacter lacisalsi]|uniref:Aminotransferase class IV n=1 Tax=Marinobacter lacisalsi TaxID=475979 RepID=A0ABV8QHW4_9GAMM
MVRILAARGLTDPVTVPGDDRGLSYGDGLFETILVRRGRPELVQAHCRRMLEGAGRLRIPLEQADLDEALDQAKSLIRQANGQDPLVLKLLLTRGSGGRGYRAPQHPEPRLLVSVHSAPPMPSAEGVAASISEVPLTVNPLLAGIKSLNRLEQVLASEQIPDTCYEAVMKGDRGDLREGTRTALLYRWQGQWMTPPRDQVAVNSVMVGHVERCLGRNGESLLEAPLYPEQCHQEGFGGLLLLNSVIGAVPVRTLAGRRLPLPERLATIVDLAKHVEEFR